MLAISQGYNNVSLILLDLIKEFPKDKQSYILKQKSHWFCQLGEQCVDYSGNVFMLALANCNAQVCEAILNLVTHVDKKSQAFILNEQTRPQETVLSLVIKKHPVFTRQIANLIKDFSPYRQASVYLQNPRYFLPFLASLTSEHAMTVFLNVHAHLTQKKANHLILRCFAALEKRTNQFEEELKENIREKMKQLSLTSPFWCLKAISKIPKARAKALCSDLFDVLSERSSECREITAKEKEIYVTRYLTLQVEILQIIAEPSTHCGFFMCRPSKSSRLKFCREEQQQLLRSSQSLTSVL